VCATGGGIIPIIIGVPWSVRKLKLLGVGFASFDRRRAVRLARRVTGMHMIGPSCWSQAFEQVDSEPFYGPEVGYRL